MNYVLISISSLSQRAKGIGVHKCNGASDRAILSMFIYETALIIGISLLFMVILLFQFQEKLKNWRECRYHLFSLGTIYGLHCR